jgi:predicted DNA-binding transcriptional regulator AlpA
MDQKQHYGLTEVSRITGISRKTVWYHIATGRLPGGEKVGRVRVFTPTEVAVIESYFSTAGGADADRVDPAINL